MDEAQQFNFEKADQVEKLPDTNYDVEPLDCDVTYLG